MAATLPPPLFRLERKEYTLAREDAEACIRLGSGGGPVQVQPGDVAVVEAAQQLLRHVTAEQEAKQAARAQRRVARAS